MIQREFKNCCQPCFHSYTMLETLDYIHEDQTKKLLVSAKTAGRLVLHLRKTHIMFKFKLIYDHVIALGVMRAK